MPFIIFGTRTLESTLDKGEFYCPRCDEEEDYLLKKATSYFALFFIPIFPVGGSVRFVQCRGCGGTFKEEMLDFEPEGPTRETLEQHRSLLKAGSCVADLENLLYAEGLSRQRARTLVQLWCDGDPVACQCGEQYHPNVKQCRRCGANL